MKSRFALIPVALISALSLSACAENYAAEGGLGGAALGAGVAAVTGGDITRYALAGAAAGALAGYFVDKDDDCDGFYDGNRNGYLDDDCRYADGYRQYWRR